MDGTGGHMIIPCKQCLKLPICISRTNISCNSLQDYFNTLHYSIRKKYVKPSKEKSIHDIFDVLLEDRNKAWDETWEEMHKTLPNINGMFRSTSRQKMAREG